MKNKIFTTLLLVIYFYTSLLPVHAFAMHSIHDTSDHKQEITENCGHPQPDHDHNSHSEKDKEHTGMSECIDQWKWTVTSDSTIFSDHTYIPYVLPPIKYEHKVSCDKTYQYSLHDPWRWDNASFTKFVMSHYWETVLHC